MAAMDNVSASVFMIVKVVLHIYLVANELTFVLDPIKTQNDNPEITESSTIFVF